MPAFSFEKLSPPARRDAPSVDSPLSTNSSESADPSSASSAHSSSAHASPSPVDHFTKMDYVCATRTRHERGFVLQMFSRLTRVRGG
jgi:hypothetical protein